MTAKYSNFEDPNLVDFFESIKPIKSNKTIDVKMSNTTEIIGEYFIFSNTYLIETIKNFVYNHAKKYKIIITDIHKQTNEFILTVDSNETNKMFYYSLYNRPYFTDPDTSNTFFNIIDNNTNDKYKYDVNMTIFEYISLLNEMIKLYDKSFNINYNKTCISEYQIHEDKYSSGIEDYLIEKIQDIKDSFFITQTNVFCKYYKIKDENDVVFLKPVFIGTYLNMAEVMFVYNICSDASEFNKTYENELNDKGLKPYRSSELFKMMIYVFELFSRKTIFALTVETRNPSYTKAYSLYYKFGFRPVFNILDTDKNNFLESSEGCIQTNADYLDCQQRSFSKILMLKTTDTNPLNYNYIKYYNDIFMSNATRNHNKIKRISNSGNKLRYFFDTALSMAYRCSCVFDEFYTKNITACSEIVNGITQYFEHNSGINQKFFPNYWKEIDGYIQISLYQQSIGKMNNLYDAVLKNPSLFRLIACVSRNFCDYSYIRENSLGQLNNDPKYRLPSIFYSDFRLRIHISHMLIYDSATKSYNEVKNVYIQCMNQKILNTQTYSFEFNVDPKNSIKDEIQNALRKGYKGRFDNILDNFENVYTDDTYPIIFIPCSYKYECNIGANSNMFDHAISMVFVKNKKRLYFYESQVLSDDNIKGMPETVKGLSTLTKEIIINRTKDTSSVKTDVYELHRFKDSDTDESLYAKIQSSDADDATGSLCVLLSHLPLYACLLLPTSYGKLVDSDEYIRFFIFMFTFYSIKMRTEQELKKEINPVLTNISVIFPYLFSGVYKMIANFNDYKDTNKLTTYRIDKDIENNLKKQTDLLDDNILLLKNELHKIFYENPNELPYELSKYLGTNIFKLKRTN